jgi:cellulose synthase/poly-beta-1,6-N-acetylglucosamine synthase-like glycosyltransferase
VVDSSSDGTDRLVSGEFPDVRLVHLPERRLVGTTRNIGVQAARGDVVLFVDADTVPGPMWLDRMLCAFREWGADAAGGSVTNGTPWSVSGSTGFYLEFFRFIEHDRDPFPTPYTVGGNSAFRRSLLETSEYLDLPAGEDLLLSARLARAGSKVLSVPRASVKHMNRTGMRTVLAYQRKLGRGACFYRSDQPSAAMRLLRTFPFLAFALPFPVMAWIGWHLGSRRRFSDLLRFLMLLPFCVAGNLFWAFGLFEALRGVQPDDRIREAAWSTGTRGPRD